jgi:hypothetical protein
MRVWREIERLNMHLAHTIRRFLVGCTGGRGGKSWIHSTALERETPSNSKSTAFHSTKRILLVLLHDCLIVAQLGVLVNV